jgi:hypothetical protein
MTALGRATPRWLEGSPQPAFLHTDDAWRGLLRCEWLKIRARPGTTRTCFSNRSTLRA